MKTARRLFLALIITTLFAGLALAQDPVELEVVGWGAGQPQVYESFMENNPGIVVTEQMMDFGDLIPFLKTRFLAEEPPDIVMLQPGAMVREFHENLVPLDEFIADDPDIDMENFVQPVLGTAFVDGTLYAIPQHPIASGLLWYNADIFNELGIEVPTNYTELQTVAQACRDGGYQPLTFNGLDAWNRQIVTGQFFAYTAPGKMEQAVAGEIPWTDPDLVEAMGWWKTLADDGVFQDGVFGTGYADAVGAFESGNACMFVAGTWFKGRALVGIRPDETVGNTLPMPFPDITNNDAEWTPGISAGHVFAISQQTDNVEEAWQVLKQIILVGDPLADYPVIIPVYGSDIPSEVLARATNAEQLEIATEFELAAWEGNTYLDEWVYPEVLDAIAEAAAGIGTGQISPEEAMQGVQAVAERVLSQ